MRRQAAVTRAARNSNGKTGKQSKHKKKTRKVNNRIPRVDFRRLNVSTRTHFKCSKLKRSNLIKINLNPRNLQ